MALDSYFANVSLLLHGDGVNGSTTFVDVTGKTITAAGTAQISTAQSKFGGSSISLSGTGYVTVPNSSAFDFSGAADFTIETWINGTAYNGYEGLFAVGDGSTISWSIYIDSGGLPGIYGILTGSGSTSLQAMHTTPLVANVWTHIALVKQAAGYKIYINGVAGALLALTGGFQYAPALPLAVGAWSSLGQSPFLGFMDEVRITKSFARYTANFTPPASPFADGAVQVAGVIRDSAGTPCARTVRLIRRDTGAVIGNTVSNASTGVYAIATPTADEVVRIVHSNTTTAPLENDLIDRVIPA